MMDPQHTASLSQIQSLEVELHHPGACCGPERLNDLLHPQFHEVGRSGREYDRETVLRFLAGQQIAPPVVSDHFKLGPLAPGLVLLTYRCAHRRPDGGLETHTLRSSVWVHEQGRWQLRYHQGTPAAEAW